MATTKGLGKGIDGLIPSDLINDAVKDSAKSSQLLVKEIPLGDLEASSAQPRQAMEEKPLKELADSIKQHGILQPIIACKNGEKYEIIAGERRFRAAKIAGLKTVPVIERSFDEQTKLETALLENLQREDLSALEAAAGFERLINEHNIKIAQIAERLGKGESTIANILRLLKLPITSKEALQSGKISEGHARAILSLDGNEQQQLQLLDLIVKNGWPVSKAEQYAKAIKDGASSAQQAMTRVASETAATKKLAKNLGAKVYIRNLASGGRLIIEFGNDDQLDSIIESLVSR